MSLTYRFRPTGWTPPAEVGVAVFSDDFESGDLTHTENGYSWGGGVNASVVAGAARNGSNGLRLTHPANLDGEDSAAQEDLAFGADLQEVWVEYWLYIPSNYHHRNSSGTDNNKFFQLWSGSRSTPNVHLYCELERGVDGQSNFSAKIANNISGDEGTYTTGRTGGEGTDPIIETSEFGSWLQFRYEVKLGTAGTEPTYDGIVRVWKDGVLYIAPPYEDRGGDVHDGVSLHATTEAENFLDQMRLLGWSNSGYDEATDFDFDDVKIYTSDPGW